MIYPIWHVLQAQPINRPLSVIAFSENIWFSQLVLVNIPALLMKSCVMMRANGLFFLRVASSFTHLLPSLFPLHIFPSSAIYEPPKWQYFSHYEWFNTRCCWKKAFFVFCGYTANYNDSGKDAGVCDYGGVLWPGFPEAARVVFITVSGRTDQLDSLCSLCLSFPIIRAICFISRSRPVAAGIFNTSYTHWWVTSLIRHTDPQPTSSRGDASLELG